MTKKGKGWFEPYILNPHNINKFVWEGKPGVYVLADLGPNSKPVVKQIRMSRNVKDELRKNLGKFHVFMYKQLTQRQNDFNENQQQLQFA